MNATARLLVALILTALLALFELAGGIFAHSVALLSDAAHVAMDVLALSISLAARLQAKRPATPRQSFGFARFEVLAALANGALLFTLTSFLVVEAFRRFWHPEMPVGSLMLAVASIGLCVNFLVGMTLVHGHGHEHHHELNVRAALLHVIGDAFGALAVVLGAVVIMRFHVVWIDPLLSLLVAVIIVLGIVRIVREAIDVLLESAPSHADTETVKKHMKEIPGVVDVHDLHVWTLGGNDHILSAHVLLQDRRISEASAILKNIDAGLRETYGINHVTVQFECESCDNENRIICTQRDR